MKNFTKISPNTQKLHITGKYLPLKSSNSAINNIIMTAINLMGLGLALILLATFILFYLIWREEDDDHWDQ